MIALALALAAAGPDSGYRRYDLMFDCAMQAEGGAKARYALFVPGFTVRVWKTTEVPDDEPSLDTYDPQRLIRIGSQSVPTVAIGYDRRKRILSVGLEVPRGYGEGIHGETFPTGDQGGNLKIEDLNRTAGTARATIVQYAEADTRAVKATYTGTCSFTHGRAALPKFESINQ
ncbi:MAG: hypothetical protein ACAH11_11875 [Sphingomonas sp.]